MTVARVDSLGAVIDELTASDYGICGLVATAAECLYWMSEDEDLPSSARVAMVYLGSNLRDAVATMDQMADFLKVLNPAHREFMRRVADFGTGAA